MWPVNLSSIFLQLDNIINMAALPKETIINALSSTKLDFIKVLNPVALIGILTAALVGICFPLLYLLKRFKIVSKLYHAIFWNILIRVLQGGYLPYCYASVKSIIEYSSDAKDLKALIMSSVILGGILVAISINAYVTLINNAKALNLKKTKDKYGACYSDIDTTRKLALFQSTLFYFIRSLLVLVLLLVPFDHNGIQCILLLHVCFVQTVFSFMVKPNIKQTLELMNQVSLHAQLIVNLAFTDANSNEDSKPYFGWVSTCLLSL